MEGGNILISLILLARLPTIFMPTYIPHRKIVANEKTIATIITSTTWYNHVGSVFIKGNTSDSNMITR
jgi:hypothetical protein